MNDYHNWCIKYLRKGNTSEMVVDLYETGLKTEGRVSSSANSRPIRSGMDTSEGTGSSHSDVTISSRVVSIFLSGAGMLLSDLSRQSTGFIIPFSL